MTEEEEYLYKIAEGKIKGEVVIAQITAAFAGIERGDGVSLHEADVIDDYGNAAQRAAARQLDVDSRWQDVPEADIERYHWILSFLDAKGFRYYAPAYMVWAIRHLYVSDSMSTDSIIYSLGWSDAFANHLQEKWSLFDNEQRYAFCAFLHFMSDNPERADANAAQEALASYWNQFCEPVTCSPKLPT